MWSIAACAVLCLTIETYAFQCHYTLSHTSLFCNTVVIELGPPLLDADEISGCWPFIMKQSSLQSMTWASSPVYIFNLHPFCSFVIWSRFYIASLSLGWRNPWAWTTEAKTSRRRKMGCIGQACNVDFVGRCRRWAWSMQIGLVKPSVNGFVIMTETRMRKTYL